MTLDPTALIPALAERAARDPVAMVRLAELLGKAQRHDEAVEWLDRALVSDDAAARYAAHQCGGLAIQQWHFNIVRDPARNESFAKAIAAAIRARPAARVLEIGAGTGLLAMHAVRAGAAEVVTCEANAYVAAGARRVIAANGMADRIRVLTAHSTGLEADRDLGWRADIVVAEVIGNQVLDEEVLPTLEHARAALAKPDAILVPQAATARIALAADNSPLRQPFASVDGFDLAPFNTLRQLSYRVLSDDAHIAPRGPALGLMRFDFAGGAVYPPERTEVTLVSAGGRVDGVVQWLHCEVGPEIDYENPPGSTWRSSWGLLFHRFEAPVETAAGDEIRVTAAHNRHRLSIWRR